MLLTIPEKCYPTALSLKYFVGPVQVLHAFLCVNWQLCWQVRLMLLQVYIKHDWGPYGVYIHACISKVVSSLFHYVLSPFRFRVEDAFFQYALLRAASWYSHCFTLSTLPLHNDTLDTLSKFTTVYHGAFMEKYASMCSEVVVDTAIRYWMSPRL